MEALKFNLDADKARGRSKPQFRKIMTAGLIVDFAHQAFRPQQEQSFGPDAAKKEICSKFESNSFFDRNETDLDRDWSKNRAVSHLAAALLHHICDNGLRRFRSAEQRVWRHDIVEFLEYANYFQHFMRGLSKQPSVRFLYDLIELPEYLGLARKKPESAVNLPSDICVQESYVPAAALLALPLSAQVQ
jgi:hypothetical protein